MLKSCIQRDLLHQSLFTQFFQEGKKKCLQIGTLSFFSLVFFNAMDTEVDAHVTPGFRDLLWKPGPDCSIWQQMNLYDSLSSCLPLKTSYAFQTIRSCVSKCQFLSLIYECCTLNYLTSVKYMWAMKIYRHKQCLRSILPVRALVQNVP